MKLDRRLWGSYHRKYRRTPLCIEPHCYKHSVYAFDEGEEVYFYCERHTGIFGANFISRAWEILEKAYEQLSQEDQD